jgi:arabinofuranan 3-O-arabinosyltransferase
VTELQLEPGTGDPERGQAVKRERKTGHQRVSPLARAQGAARSLVRRRPLALLAIAFAVLSLAATLTSQPGSYVGDARLEHVTEPGQYLTRQAYIWDDERGLGKPASHFSFSPAPAALQAVLGTLGAQPWLIERLIHALYLTLAALGVILLMREFLPRVGLAHVIAAFVYTFSPFTTQFLLPSNLFLYYALAPWFAWIVYRGVRGRDPWRWAAAFALAIAAVGTLNVANLVYALIPAAVIALYFALRQRGGPRELWSWTWRTGMLTALTCSAAIVVLWYSAPDVGVNLRTTELPEQVARTSSWFESWRGLGFWFTYPQFGGLLRANVAPYFTAYGVIAASFVASIGALLGLALTRWRHRVLFGAMLLVSLVLMVGIHGAGGRSPLGELLSFAFDHSEFARGFRTPYKAGPGLMLAIGALLGVATASAYGAITTRRGGETPRQRPRTRAQRLAPALVVGVIALGVGVASFPFWTGRLYPEDEEFRSIPGYWDRAFDYLGAQEHPGRVLVLPASERGRYRWGGVHDNLFDGFSSLSPVVNSALPQATAESGDLVAAIDDYVSSTGYVKGTLGPMLARLGVRWVLLQNDLDWQHGSVPRPSTYDPLRSDPDLRIAATFGRRGKNTSASLGDRDAERLGEQSLPPVEVYEVAGTPSPQPRLASGPPLLVEGGGESWPSLATARLLDGPPIAYTGAADNDVLSKLLASGSELAVTDGNRRRATAVTIGRPARSSTLAAGETTDRPSQDLFGSAETQSVATYADAHRIFASRSGNELEAPYDPRSRPANAFDRVERTAWQVRGPRDPTDESVTVEFRKPVAVTAVSVLPYADGNRSVKAVDVIAHSDGGESARRRLQLDYAQHTLPVARFEPAEVSAIEIRIARVDGDTGAVGITEAAIGTPGGQLDLREFVRTPDDLAMRAASDERLGAALAERPPRYELRRLTGAGPQQPSFAAQDEETELRREITAFGDHRYELDMTARIDSRAADSAIDALLGAPVGAVGTSRFGGDVERRSGLAVDNDLSTGWEPEILRGPRVDLRFPTTEVRSVEVFVVSGPRRGSRVTDIAATVGGRARTSSLPRSRRCKRPTPPNGGCLETHVVRFPPTDTDHLSVTLTGVKTTSGPLVQFPPRVVEVRVNGRQWPEPRDMSSRENCAPLIAVDGRPVNVRLPSNPQDVLAGRLLELQGCEPIRLGPGRHRIESLPGLSGAVLTASLVPLDAKPLADERDDTQRQPGTVRLLDRSPTRLQLQVDAPKGALLVGGMPWHEGWVADGGELRRSPVPLDTFTAWTVEAPAAGAVTLEFQPQQTYELAIALSVGAAVWCLWRVTRRQRRRVR